jgi:ubiquinone/menaquinone biosynthesis C-methylase UbiE
VIDLTRRSTEGEMLDEGVADDEALRSLADLRFVARWLGNRRAFTSAVLPFLAGSPRPSILDVGCGSGEVLSGLRRASGKSTLAVGVDLRPLHLSIAPADVVRVAADVRRLPFAPRSFDVVTASLFLHHFDAPDLPGVLRGLYAVCRRALVVNDLRRARVPYLFGRAFFKAMFQSPVSVADGLVSIRRSFLPRELADAFTAAGIRDARIRRTFPYRLIAVAERPPGS